MKRPSRHDAPGAIHHAWSRGVARRSIYDCAEDRRRFERLMEFIGERGWVKILAYSLLGNHFHTMGLSPAGQLSRGVGRMKQLHALWFNRLRDRDGPLFSGRFGSRRLYTPEDRIRVVRYIDNNPVKAGLVDRPEEWPFGSAYWYVRPSGPPWLHREIVEQDIQRLAGRDHYDPTDYLERIDPKSMHAIEWWVESGMTSRRRRGTEADMEDLARSGGSRLLRERALAADGVWEPVHLVPPRILDEAIAHARANMGPWRVYGSRRSICGWAVLRAGLLEMVSGCSRQETARSVGVSLATVDRYRAMLAWLLASSEGMTKARAVLAHAGAETARLLALHPVPPARDAVS